jgi:hypothetical protein
MIRYILTLTIWGHLKVPFLHLARKNDHKFDFGDVALLMIRRISYQHTRAKIYDTKKKRIKLA